MVLPPDGSPIYANKSTVHGLTAEEVLRPGVRSRVCHPDDLTALEAERREGMRRGVLSRRSFARAATMGGTDEPHNGGRQVIAGTRAAA